MRRRLPVAEAPERLLPEQRARIQAWARSHARQVELHLGRHWAECRDWHRANGILRADWEAAFRNWLRKAIEFEERDRGPLGYRPRQGTRSRLQGQPARSDRDGETLSETLGDVIQLFKKGDVS